MTGAPTDVERLARGLERRRLTGAALLWLEFCRPVSRLLGQGLRLVEPLATALVPDELIAPWRAVLDDPDRYAALLDRLERGSDPGGREAAR